MEMCFELVDLGVSSNTPATVLFDTASAGARSNVHAGQLYVLRRGRGADVPASAGYFRVAQTGSVWVTSTLGSGVRSTRLIGVAGEGVDCLAQEAGGTAKVTFLSGRVPVPRRNSHGAVSAERTCGGAAGRRGERGGGGGGGSRAGRLAGWAGWCGPQARSSVDCESAATAILSFATARSAALRWNGAAGGLRRSLVWEASRATTSGRVMRMLIAAGGVTLEWYRAAGRDRGWAFGAGGAAVRGGFCQRLGGGAGTEAVGSDRGGCPAAGYSFGRPAGGAGEPAGAAGGGGDRQARCRWTRGLVPPAAGAAWRSRRRDGGFGPGESADLVLRSPVRSFAIPTGFGGRAVFRSDVRREASRRCIHGCRVRWFAICRWD